VCIVSSLLWAQQKNGDSAVWQEQVRKYAEAQDWNAALQLVEREIAQFPGDLDVIAWRARLLFWSGKFRDAEHDYLVILSVSANDPDHWLGLASVYSREGRREEAKQALDRAVELDPRRSDIRTARARELRELGRRNEARMEFRRALELDSGNGEARRELRILTPIPNHEARIGFNADLFSFANARQSAGVIVSSRWTPRWATMAAAESYRWTGMDAEKLTVSVTGKLPRWGAITLGGATANDDGVIPRREALIGYGQGWNLSSEGQIRGLEADYEQHWYWYSNARILTFNELLMFYLPGEWTWSLRITAARSEFSGTSSSEWRPSGFSRLGFPIVGSEQRRLVGSLLFAAGAENFAQADQIGRFSSQTYGSTLRLQFTPSQDLTGMVAHQKRTGGRTETSFGFSYGIRF
jgi:tetratricopeptide (TPR) repeat protein